jgi:hypothetical protein
MLAQDAEARPRIEKVVMARGKGGAFILDSNGEVWAFEWPDDFEKITKIIGVKDVVDITPYAALDKNGDIFTWTIEAYKEDYSEYGHTAISFGRAARMAHLSAGASFDALLSKSQISFFYVNANNSLAYWPKRYGDVFYAEGGMSEKSLKIANTPTIIGESNANIVSVAQFGVGVIGSDGSLSLWRRHREDSDDLQRVPLSLSEVVKSRPKKIRVNSHHIAIITDEGDVAFWGTCSRFSSLSEGLAYIDDSKLREIKPRLGPIRGVLDLAMPDEDDTKFDLYIRNDNTVWVSRAPTTNNDSDAPCGNAQNGYKSRQVDRVFGISVSTNGSSTHVVLDRDRHILVDFNSAATNFVKVPLPEFE